MVLDYDSDTIVGYMKLFDSLSIRALKERGEVPTFIQVVFSLCGTPAILTSGRKILK